MRKESIELVLAARGLDGKFFLLTRDHTVEITETGADDYDKKGTLFFYSNQWSYQKPSEEPDIFGRNYIDQVFISLCIRVETFLALSTPKKEFKLLTTRKEGGDYIVELRYDDTVVIMEVEEMYRYLGKLLEEQK